jgi:hypothetical protein
VIGAVELGADFGPIFLDYINRTFPGKWGIYNLKRGVRSIDDTHLVAFFGGDKDKSAGTNFRNDCNPIFIRSVASKQVGSKRMNKPSWRRRPSPMESTRQAGGSGAGAAQHDSIRVEMPVEYLADSWID